MVELAENIPVLVSLSHSSVPFVPQWRLLLALETLDYRIFCQGCRERTYHEIRYQSDNQFVGRVLICPNCDAQILEPIGPGTRCQDC